MYSVLIRVEGWEAKRRSVRLLHILAGFFLLVKGIDYYRFTQYADMWPVIPVLLISAFALFYGFFRKKLDPQGIYNGRFRLAEAAAFMLLGFLLLNTGKPIEYLGVFAFAALTLLLFFTERKLFAEPLLLFTQEGISVPGNYGDQLVRWEELTEVVVREDFITLFHIEEKYLQFQVAQDLSTLETAKMNAFSRERIEAASSSVRREE